MLQCGKTRRIITTNCDRELELYSYVLSQLIISNLCYCLLRGENDTLVNAQIGTTAKLPCVIFNRDDHETVSQIAKCMCSDSAIFVIRRVTTDTFPKVYQSTKT